MALYFHSVKTRSRIHLLLALLLLLSPALLTRPSLKLSVSEFVREGEEETLSGSMIGSKPPPCEGICRACGHCEAVQVPLVSQQRNVDGMVFRFMGRRGDESSNYKPLSWKCKCGNVILNP